MKGSGEFTKCHLTFTFFRIDVILIKSIFWGNQDFLFIFYTLLDHIISFCNLSFLYW